MTEQNKQVVALAKEHGLWPDHDEVKERFVDGAELKESLEAFAAGLLLQNKQPPAEAGEGAVAEVVHDSGRMWIRILDYSPLHHGDKLYTSQTAATQAAVAAAMRKCAGIADSWVNLPRGQRAKFFHEIRDEILAATPAEATAALRELVEAVIDYSRSGVGENYETEECVDRILAEKGPK